MVHIGPPRLRGIPLLVILGDIPDICIICNSDAVHTNSGSVVTLRFSFLSALVFLLPIANMSSTVHTVHTTMPHHYHCWPCTTVKAVTALSALSCCLVVAIPQTKSMPLRAYMRMFLLACNCRTPSPIQGEHLRLDLLKLPTFIHVRKNRTKF